MSLALLLSLLGLFAVPSAEAQVRQPVVREERVRATPAALAPAPAQQPAPVQAAQQTPAPKPAAQPVNFTRAVEQEIFRLVNAERAKKGLVAFKADSKLDSIARAHSADMLANDYFSHTNKSGCGTACRLANAEYGWSAFGENIYSLHGYTLSAAEVARKMVEGWMDSAGHRANILNAKFTNHGIGVAQSGTDIYATSDFTLPH